LWLESVFLAYNTKGFTVHIVFGGSQCATLQNGLANVGVVLNVSSIDDYVPDIG